MVERLTRRPSSAEATTARFASVVEAFTGMRGVTTGKMMASPGLRVRGKIFAMLVRHALVVKLPAQRVQELVAAGKGRQFDPRGDGRLMREWVVVERPDDPPWLELAREAHRFVARATPLRRRPRG